MFKETLASFNKWPLWQRAVAGGMFLVLIWVMFFDSHSLASRVLWHREYEALRAANAALEQQISALKEQLDEGISDEMVEQIAREQYSMQRPGETVYPIEEPEED